MHKLLLVELSLHSNQKRIILQKAYMSIAHMCSGIFCKKKQNRSAPLCLKHLKNEMHAC